MKIRLIPLLLLFCFLQAKSQRSQVNMNLSFGPLHFFNQHGGNYSPGTSRHLGFNVFLNRKKRAMVFRPGISFVKNVFNSRIENNLIQTQVMQHLVNVNLDVLLRIGKKVYLKTGLFFSNVRYSTIEVIYRNGSMYFSHGNSDMTKGYEPNTFQAGPATGVCLPFKIKNSELKFEITFQQYATAVVNSDYHNPNLKGIEDKPSVTSKVRPSVVLFTLEVALYRQEKPVKKEIEE